MYFQNSFIIGIINFNDVMVEFDALNGCKEITNSTEPRRKTPAFHIVFEYARQSLASHTTQARA